MLPHDISRCAGFLGQGPERCTRRFTCARFQASGRLTLSACGAGVDAYIHADSLIAAPAAGYPYALSSDGVLSVNTVNTSSALSTEESQ